jgi:hypothetical protein
VPFRKLAEKRAVSAAMPTRMGPDRRLCGGASTIFDVGDRSNDQSEVPAWRGFCSDSQLQADEPRFSAHRRREEAKGGCGDLCLERLCMNLRVR